MANLTAPMIPIVLERQDISQPWGIRLQGGSDYRLHLSVKKVIIQKNFFLNKLFLIIYLKVTPNTPSHQRLHTGDVIVGIQGNDSTQLTHLQANELIKMSGNTLNLMVRK
jgi:hypothetical protein